jgi:hypothetical protein
LVIALGVLVIIVMAAVEFDDQMLGGTEEIHDIRADWSLTAEVVPSTGSSFSARHRMRSCGVVLARSLLAAARRIDVETIFAAHPTPLAARPTLPLQGRVRSAQLRASPQFVPNMNLPSPSRYGPVRI